MRPIPQTLKFNLDMAQIEQIISALDSWRHNHFNGKGDEDFSGEYLTRESQLDLAKHFFELGLKWMSEQGVTVRASIYKLSCGLYNQCVEAGLTSEDDTIIQVRKLND